MTITIKREKWKRKGFMVVVRDNGKILSRRRWTRKFNLRKATSKFRNDNTLAEDIAITKLKNVREFRSSRLAKPKNVRFGVRASVRIDNEVIAASSMFRRWNSAQDAKQEALENLALRVSQAISGEYDEDSGMQQLMERNLLSRVKFDVVYYKGL